MFTKQKNGCWIFLKQTLGTPFVALLRELERVLGCLCDEVRPVIQGVKTQIEDVESGSVRDDTDGPVDQRWRA
jgi:hypothetical protein